MLELGSITPAAYYLGSQPVSRIMLGATEVWSGMDADAAAYLSATGASDEAAIVAFVEGVKTLGLWADLVCWPLRSTQNHGSGSALASLGGYSSRPATLYGSPAWAADGFSAVNNVGHSGRVNSPFAFGASHTLVSVLSAAGLAGTGTGVTALVGDSSSPTLQLSINGSRQFSLRSTQFGGSMTYTGVTARHWLAARISPTAQALYRDGSAGANRADAIAGGFAFDWVFSSPALTVVTGSLVYSFTAIFPARLLSGTELEDFRALYKSTLGSGLSLP